MRRILVILAVESYIVRKGLSAILNGMKGVSVLKETPSADQLDEQLETLSPDFCILCESSRRKLSSYLSAHPEWYMRLILISDHTVIHMEEPCCETIDILEAKEKVVEKLERALYSNSDTGSFNEADILSNREKTILEYLCKGLTNKQIAEKLFLSGHTVNTHRKNISSKLGIKSLSGLTVYAILNKLVTIEEVAMNLENES